MPLSVSIQIGVRLRLQIRVHARVSHVDADGSALIDIPLFEHLLDLHICTRQGFKSLLVKRLFVSAAANVV